MRALKRWCIPAMVLAALGTAVPSLAQEKAVSQGAVAFVSGGIGVDSQERLQALEKEFNLKLVFTLVEGNYLADVNVVVKDGAGKILVEHLAEGPFFLAKLPAGRYSVAATYEGRTVTRKVSVGAKGLRTEYLRWPGNPQADFPLPPEREDGPKTGAKAQRR